MPIEEAIQREPIVMPETVNKPEHPCPICGNPAVHEYRPFCCRRCADVDLNRWLSGAYVVPGRADDEDGIPDDPARGGDKNRPD